MTVKNGSHILRLKPEIINNRVTVTKIMGSIGVANK